MILWRILSENEVRSLNAEQLREYLAWLKEYKRSNRFILLAKQEKLNKMLAASAQQRAVALGKKDSEDLDEIRKKIKELT